LLQGKPKARETLGWAQVEKNAGAAGVELTRMSVKLFVQEDIYDYLIRQSHNAASRKHRAGE
jgi:hypothetical protein